MNSRRGIPRCFPLQKSCFKIRLTASRQSRWRVPNAQGKRAPLPLLADSSIKNAATHSRQGHKKHALHVQIHSVSCRCDKQNFRRTDFHQAEKTVWKNQHITIVPRINSTSECHGRQHAGSRQAQVSTGTQVINGCFASVCVSK